MYTIKEKNWKTQCRICKEHKTEVYKVSARRLTIKHDDSPDIENRLERMFIQLNIKNDLNVGIEPNIIAEALLNFNLERSGNSNVWKNIMKFFLCTNCMVHYNNGYFLKLNDTSRKYVYKCWVFIKKFEPKLKMFSCHYCKQDFSKQDINILQSDEGYGLKFKTTRTFCSEACSNIWILTNEKK